MVLYVGTLRTVPWGQCPGMGAGAEDCIARARMLWLAILRGSLGRNVRITMTSSTMTVIVILTLSSTSTVVSPSPRSSTQVVADCLLVGGLGRDRGGVDSELRDGCAPCPPTQPAEDPHQTVSHTR